MIEAIQSGRLGRIAICYIEWSGIGNQRVLIDWTVIEDAASAQRFAVQLAEAPRSFFSRTSISGGIDFAMRQSSMRGLTRSAASSTCPATAMTTIQGAT